MRQFPVLTAPLAALLLVAPCVRCEEPAPPKPTHISVPDEIGAAVIEGDALYALTSKNKLLRVDLQTHNATTIVAFPAEIKVESLTVGDGKACARARDEKSIATFYVVDVAAKKVTNTLKTALVGHARPGFVFGDELYVVGGSDVQIYTISTAQLETKIKVGGGILADSHRVGDRLYLAREYAGGVGVIDMKEGKLLDLIETKDWLYQVRAGNDKAFVWGEFDGVGAIDLKTRQYTNLEQPEAATSRRILTLQAGPDDGLLVFNSHSFVVHQYNAAGKLMGQTPIDKSAGTFVGAWNSCAVFIASAKGVTLVPLTNAQKAMD